MHRAAGEPDVGGQSARPTQMSLRAVPAGVAPGMRVRRRRLPDQPTPLFGREHELATARRILTDADVRLLTLIGVGGAGKTRLAREIARRLQPRFEHGALEVDLTRISDPSQMSSAIARELRMSGTLLPSPGQPLVDALADAHLLLLLDNFEHILSAALELSHLLALCPALKVLVTSRAALHLRWEHELSVPPLALPEAGRRADAASASRAPAVQLFVNRLRAFLPHFALTDENAPTIAAICARLDGLPLAIELAAARGKVLSPTGLLEALSGGLELLADGAVDLPARQRTLRDTIAWSHRLLPPAAQVLFRQLAVFVSGCTLEAAEVVCGSATEPPSPTVVGGLAALIDNCLLRRAGDDEVPRFVMLQTVREYGLNRLAESGELEEMRHRHAEFFRHYAEQAGREYAAPQEGAVHARLEREHGNLRAALSWFADSGQAELGLRLAVALWRFWSTRGLHAEGRQWLDRFLAMDAPSCPPRTRAHGLACAGVLAWEQGDYAAARPLLEESLTLRRELGDGLAIARSLTGLGVVAGDQGDDEAARRLAEEALQIRRELGHPIGIAYSLSNLGLLAYRRGDYPAAQNLLDEGVSAARGRGDLWILSELSYRLADVAAARGEPSVARAHLEQGLKLSRELGDHRGLVCALEGFASLAVGQDRRDHALRLAGAADALRARGGIAVGSNERARLTAALETVEQALGAAAEAARADGRAMTLAQAIDLALTAEPDARRARRHRALDTLAPLSGREQAVAALIAEGLTNRQIAERLVIGTAMVNSHVNHILNRLGFNWRAQIAAWVTERQLRA